MNQNGLCAKFDLSKVLIIEMTQFTINDLIKGGNKIHLFRLLELVLEPPGT